MLNKRLCVNINLYKQNALSIIILQINFIIIFESFVIITVHKTQLRNSFFNFNVSNKFYSIEFNYVF